MEGYRNHGKADVRDGDIEREEEGESHQRKILAGGQVGERQVAGAHEDEAANRGRGCVEGREEPGNALLIAG